MGANSPIFEGSYTKKKGKFHAKKPLVQHEWNNENDENKEKREGNFPQKINSLKKNNGENYESHKEENRKRPISAKVDSSKRRHVEEENISSPTVQEDEKEFPLTTSSGDEGVAFSAENLSRGNLSSPEQYSFSRSPDHISETDEEEYEKRQKEWKMSISFPTPASPDHISETDEEEYEKRQKEWKMSISFPTPASPDHISETDEEEYEKRQRKWKFERCSRLPAVRPIYSRPDACDPIKLNEGEGKVPHAVTRRVRKPLTFFSGDAVFPPSGCYVGEDPTDPIKDFSNSESETRDALSNKKSLRHLSTSYFTSLSSGTLKKTNSFNSVVCAKKKETTVTIIQNRSTLFYLNEGSAEPIKHQVRRAFVSYPEGKQRLESAIIVRSESTYNYK